MPIGEAYRDDLAYIHDAGYGALSEDAASRLLEELAHAGHHHGLVIDLGCGSGILAHRVTAAGYHVLGVDVSEAMVALARKRVPAAQFRVGSFVSADLPPSVAVTAIGEVLNYGFDPGNDEAARAALFQRVFRALLPGGLLLFDVAGPERARPGGPHRTFAMGDGWAVLVETDAPNAGQLTRTITTFRQAGDGYRRDDEVHRLTLVDPAALVESLRAVGFEVQPLARYGAVSMPPGVVAFLCRKPMAPSNQARELQSPR